MDANTSPTLPNAQITDMCSKYWNFVQTHPTSIIQLIVCGPAKGGDTIYVDNMSGFLMITSRVTGTINDIDARDFRELVEQVVSLAKMNEFTITDMKITIKNGVSEWE